MLRGQEQTRLQETHLFAFLLQACSFHLFPARSSAAGSLDLPAAGALAPQDVCCGCVSFLETGAHQCSCNTILV